MAIVLKPRAAVVDDDRLTRLIVRKTLERAGYDVEEGDCGTAALRLALGAPDVMVLDLQLPDMSGLAVCQAVPKTTAVVFLTADDTAATVDQCLRSGAMDCVHKPVAPDDLSARVDLARRLRQEGVRRAAH